MSEYCLTNTLYENQLEARIEGYKAHVKALESEIDKICVMWDEDRNKLKYAEGLIQDLQNQLNKEGE